MESLIGMYVDGLRMDKQWLLAVYKSEKTGGFHERAEWKIIKRRIYIVR